jgi:hypothetical protein
MPGQNIVIREFVTEATPDSLNEAIKSRGVSVDRILSVFLVPGQVIANGPRDRFRVLYHEDAREILHPVPDPRHHSENTVVPPIARTPRSARGCQQQERLP